MKGIALNEAVAMIPDGATLMIGGFMGVGTPERVMDELVRQGKRDLTVIANDTAMSGVGIGKLIGAKRVRKTLSKGIDSWADVDAAFDYWAQKLRYRLCQESGRGGCAAPAQ